MAVIGLLSARRSEKSEGPESSAPSPPTFHGGLDELKPGAGQCSWNVNTGILIILMHHL